MSEVYKIVNIRMSGNEPRGNNLGSLRPNTTYADLLHEDGTTAISATLEFILSEIRDRGLAVEDITIQLKVRDKHLCSEVILDKYKEKTVDPNLFSTPLSWDATPFPKGGEW